MYQLEKLPTLIKKRNLKDRNSVDSLSFGEKMVILKRLRRYFMSVLLGSST